MSSIKVTRPVLRYYGGKFRLAEWIISMFPKHRFYVEPFGGAANVLMAKARSFGEVYNDLDEEVVNVFRVLRETGSAARLRELIALTPYARCEFDEAFLPTDDLVERARRTIVKSFFGFGPEAIFSSRPADLQMRTAPSTWTGMRSARKRGTTPATDWARYPELIAQFTKRLQGVVVENRDAIEVMQKYDDADALHYVDPPYVASSRACRHGYRHEMDDTGHAELAACVRGLRGAVVLSGYRSELYQDLFGDWCAFERPAMAQGARPRVEVVWLNPMAAEMNIRLF